VTVSAVTKYYMFGGQRVAMRQGDVVYFIHSNHLGSTSLTTDQSGAPVAETRYLPYGEERWTNEAQPTDFTFTGQRAERGFGLMDYNARYYDPWLGRFVSADSIVPNYTNPQALNRYSYVLNSPLKYADPTGHCWDPLTGSADKCIAAWQRTVEAYEAGERRPGVLALHASGITDRLVATSEKINRLNQDADLAFSNAPIEERLMPSIRLGLWATGTAAAVVGTGQLAQAAGGAIGNRAGEIAFQEGFSDAEMQTVARIAEKYELNLDGVKVWRGEGAPAEYVASWDAEGLTLYDSAFISEENLAKGIYEELIHLNQEITEFGVANVQSAEVEAGTLVDEWWQNLLGGQ
jgi:RHS repeat-associated protein